VDQPKPTLETALTAALDQACSQGDREVATRLFVTLVGFLARDPWAWGKVAPH
jgi:hypothetical protein